MTAAYQLTESTSIIRVSDGAYIPPDEGNCDYQAYQAWVAAGGVADPYVAPIMPLPKQAQAQLDIITGPRGQIIRCIAAGLAVPSAWQSYIVALRAIANGSDTTSTSLPTQPAFIAGT